MDEVSHYSLSGSHCYDVLACMDLQRKERNEAVCDVRFVMGNECLYAHRSVLVVCSAYFQGMMSGAFMESQGEGGTNSKMMEVDVSGSMSTLQDLDNLLTAMYTGSLTLSINNIMGVTELACFLLVERVRETCEQFLLENLSLQTCLPCLSLAHQYDLALLFRSCRQLLQSRFHDYFIHQQEMLHTPAPCLRLLTKIFHFVRLQDILQFLAEWVDSCDSTGAGGSHITEGAGFEEQEQKRRLTVASDLVSCIVSDLEKQQNPHIHFVSREKLVGRADILGELLSHVGHWVKQPQSIVQSLNTEPVCATVEGVESSTTENVGTKLPCLNVEVGREGGGIRSGSEQDTEGGTDAQFVHHKQGEDGIGCTNSCPNALVGISDAAHVGQVTDVSDDTGAEKESDDGDTACVEREEVSVSENGDKDKMTGTSDLRKATSNLAQSESFHTNDGKISTSNVGQIDICRNSGLGNVPNTNIGNVSCSNQCVGQPTLASCSPKDSCSRACCSCCHHNRCAEDRGDRNQAHSCHFSALSQAQGNDSDIRHDNTYPRHDTSADNSGHRNDISVDRADHSIDTSAACRDSSSGGDKPATNRKRHTSGPTSDAPHPSSHGSKQRKVTTDPDSISDLTDVVVAFVPGKKAVKYFTATDCEWNRPRYCLVEFHVCVYHIRQRQWLWAGSAFFPDKFEERYSWRMACVNLKAYFLSVGRRAVHVLDLKTMAWSQLDCEPLLHVPSSTARVCSLVPIAVGSKLYVLASNKQPLDDGSESFVTLQQYFLLEKGGRWKPVATVTHRHVATPLTLLSVSDNKVFTVKATIPLNLGKSMLIMQEGHVLDCEKEDVRKFAGTTYAASPIRILVRDGQVHTVDGNSVQRQLQLDTGSWDDKGFVDLTDIKVGRASSAECHLPCLTHSSSTMGASVWEFSTFPMHRSALTELCLMHGGDISTRRHTPPPFYYVSITTACQLDSQFVDSLQLCRYLHADRVN